jgi:hypothetical protein
MKYVVSISTSQAPIPTERVWRFSIEVYTQSDSSVEEATYNKRRQD